MKLNNLLALSLVVCLANTSWSREKISFSKRKIWVGTHELIVEVADTHKKIQRGLMYRTTPLRDNEGMLFIFNNVQMRRFWMKNTFIPLSIGFFNGEKELVHTRIMKPVRSEMENPETYPSKYPAKYVLEVAPGWFARKKIQKRQKGKKGAQLRL